MILEKISEKLKHYKRKIVDDIEGFIKSAICIPIYQKGEEYYILLTKRTNAVNSHKGQICCPGGVLDKEDADLFACAKRECEEEIGVKRDQIKLIGALDDFNTRISKYIITPFVVQIPYPYDFKLNKKEIEYLIELPLQILMDKNNVKVRDWVYNNNTYKVYEINYQGEIIWGATGAILKNLADVCFPSPLGGEG